jgi:hypothetical protein
VGSVAEVAESGALCRFVNGRNYFSRGVNNFIDLFPQTVLSPQSIVFFLPIKELTKGEFKVAPPGFVLRSLLFDHRLDTAANRRPTDRRSRRHTGASDRRPFEAPVRSSAAGPQTVTQQGGSPPGWINGASTRPKRAAQVRIKPSTSASAHSSVFSIGSPCIWRTVILVMVPCVKICAAIFGGAGEPAIDGMAWLCGLG